MNEIEVPLKVTGVTEIKKQLRELKDSYLKATDPSQMAAIADQAGNLQKKLDGANKAFAGFTEGTNLEQTQNAFTNLKDSGHNFCLLLTSQEMGRDYKSLPIIGFNRWSGCRSVMDQLR